MILLRNSKLVLQLVLVMKILLVHSSELYSVEKSIKSIHLELHGDGPWNGHLTKHIHNLERQKDQATCKVEQQTEKDSHKIQNFKELEKQQVVEHALSLKHDIENWYIVNKELALRNDIEQKLYELEKDQYDLLHHTRNAIYNIETQVNELELKRHRTQLQHRQNLFKLEKEKQDLTFTKQEIEKHINVLQMNTEGRAYKYQQIVENQPVVQHHPNHELQNLKHQKQELDLNYQKDRRHSYDLEHQHELNHKFNHQKHILEQDLALKRTLYQNLDGQTEHKFTQQESIKSDKLIVQTSATEAEFRFPKDVETRMEGVQLSNTATNSNQFMISSFARFGQSDITPSGDLKQPSGLGQSEVASAFTSGSSNTNDTVGNDDRSSVISKKFASPSNTSEPFSASKTSMTFINFQQTDISNGGLPFIK